jgi:hypothetical protein
MAEEKPTPTAGRVALGVLLGVLAAAVGAGVVLGLGLVLNEVLSGLVGFLDSLPRLFIVIVVVLTVASIVLPFATMLLMHVTVGSLAAPVVRHYAAGAGPADGRVRRAADVVVVCAVPLVFAVEQVAQPHLDASSYMSRMLLGAFGRGVPGLGGSWTLGTWAHLAAAIVIALWVSRRPEEASDGEAGAEAKRAEGAAPGTPMTSPEMWKALGRGESDEAR